MKDQEYTAGENYVALGATAIGDAIGEIAPALGATAVGDAIGEVVPALGAKIEETGGWQAGLFLKKGQMVDDYQIISFIKESGEAQVYKAVSNGKEYVVKIYKNDISLKPEVSERLEKENHPNLARMVKVGNISIEFRVGEFLQKEYEVSEFYRVVNKPVAYEELRKLIEQINEGLNYLHQIHIFHKDIKPANIMLDEAGNYRIIDFGISSVGQEGQTSLNFTKTGLSVDYASPEAREGGAGIREDYYSFGISIYELFTGKLPYSDLGEAYLRNKELKAYGVKVTPALNMPKDLEKLIHGLTYYSNIPEKNKRRWGYQEVKQWLVNPSSMPDLIMGTEQDRENLGQGKTDHRASSPVFQKYFGYKGKKIWDSYTLADTLGSYWNDGKASLARGLLRKLFEENGSGFADLYNLAENSLIDLEQTTDDLEENIIFWKFLYQLEPNLEKFYWYQQKDTGSNDTNNLGQGMNAYTCEEIGVYFFLNPMGTHDSRKRMPEVIQEIIDAEILPQYIRNQVKNQSLYNKVVKYIEEFKYDDCEVAAWKLGYALTGKSLYSYHGKLFETKKQLYQHLIEWTNSLSLEEAVEVANQFEQTKEYKAWLEFQEEA